MRRLETECLSGFNTTDIDQPASFDVRIGDDRQLSYETLVTNTPAITSSYDGWRNTQTVLGRNDGLPHWDESAYFPAGRLAGIHGRSVEVLASKVNISDSFGNEYQSINIKGSDFTNPHLMEHPTAERDYIIHGLQESLVMERVLRASRLLRQHGVGTEYIFGLALPEGFPLDPNNYLGDTRKAQYLVDMKEAKELPEFLEHLATKFAQDKTKDTETDPLQIKADMIERFSDCDYIVSYRGMDCPYRFSELGFYGNYLTLRDTLIKNNDEIGISEYFRDHNLFNYLRDEFAPHLASNVAKMHALGLVHGFLHSSNITAMGSIVDLDSCRGEALGLGDEAVTDRQQIGDVLTCLASIEEVYRRLHNNHYKESPEDFRIVQVWLHQTSLSFLNSYLTERFDTHEGKVAYLAEMLLHVEDVAANINGLSVVQFTERIFDSYRMITDTHPVTAEDVTESLAVMLPRTPISKRTTFLKALPASYIREQSSYAMGVDTLNDQTSIAENDRRVYHTLRFTVGNICLKEVIAAYKNDPHLDPETFLNTIGFIHEKHDDQDGNTNPKVLKAKAELEAYNTYVIDELTQESHPDNFVQAPLDRFVTDVLSDLRDQLAHLTIDGREVPVLYARGNQYAEILAKILDGKSPPRVEFIDYTDSKLLFENVNDALIVSDYIVAERLAGIYHQHEMPRALLKHYPSLRPAIIIKNILEGETCIQVIHSGRHEVASRSDFYQLLELLMPDTRQKAQARLSRNGE